MNTFCLAILWLLAILPITAQAQSAGTIPVKTAKKYFIEARSVCEADDGHLWGVSLCGPMMLVDPQSRFIVANQADGENALRAEDGVFVGTLPADRTIANTATEWSGVLWTQMLGPLPEDERQRETLMAHELFHRIQGRLNLPEVKGGENAHLDTLKGRYLLQLEWRALASALGASTDAERRRAAEDATIFRAERYRLFPDAAAQEQSLELNEGLAEYTGVRVGNATAQEQLNVARKDITIQTGDDTFVRSFAYATGPAYGLLLDRYNPGWRGQLKAGEGFGTQLRNALHLPLPVNLSQVADQRAAVYGGADIRTAEAARAAKRQQIMAACRAKFVDGPTLTLNFRHMHVQFDPRNLQPLDKAVMVYPTMKVSDDWGVLDAKNGALMRPDWSAVIVSAPVAGVSAGAIQGDGWTLELKPGWVIVLGERKGDFVLSSGS